MLQNFLYFFALLYKRGKLIGLNISKRKDNIEQHYGSTPSHLAENIKCKTDFLLKTGLKNKKGVTILLHRMFFYSVALN